MPTQHHGSCLCGAVHFTIAGTFDRFYLCHCQHCRKDTGSTHAANLFSAGARLEWQSGQEQVRTYRLPDTRHARSFCATCGSALPYAEEGMLVVPAGCLDSEPGIAATAHIFLASRASWDHDLARLPGFAAAPR